jgi:hypothetical protein
MAHRQVFLALLLVACGETASEPVPAPDAPVCYEIGFATQLPDGAIVPVLNDASISNGFACSGFVGFACPYGSTCVDIETHTIDSCGNAKSVYDGMGHCEPTDEGRCGPGLPSCPFAFVCDAQQGRCVPACTCHETITPPDGYVCGYNAWRTNPRICIPAAPPRDSCSDSDPCPESEAYLCVGGHCRVRCLDTSGCPSGSVCEELEQHVSYCKTPSDAATD